MSFSSRAEYGIYGRFPLDIWGLIFRFLSFEELCKLVLNSHFTKLIRIYIERKRPPQCLADLDILKWFCFTTDKKVQVKKSKQIFILKSLEFSNANSSLHWLKTLSHPFLFRGVSYFQEEKKIYILSPYFQDHSLRVHLFTLKEADARFYAAEILMLYEYLHSKEIYLAPLEVCMTITFPFLLNHLSTGTVSALLI